MTPIEIGADVGLATLSLGWFHGCGVAATGRAYCWGFNESGELGNGSQVNSTVLVRVAARP
jgi:alpha-tubulin suppressor-like RCC1 family protein